MVSVLVGCPRALKGDLDRAGAGREEGPWGRWAGSTSAVRRVRQGLDRGGPSCYMSARPHPGAERGEPGAGDARCEDRLSGQDGNRWGSRAVGEGAWMRRGRGRGALGPPCGTRLSAECSSALSEVAAAVGTLK